GSFVCSSTWTNGLAIIPSYRRAYAPPRAASTSTLLHLPVLVPRGISADPFALHLHVDHVRLVLARRLVDAAPQRWLELLQRLDRLALHALGAREPGVVRGRRIEVKPGILAGVHHLAVRYLARPVGADDLVGVVVRDPREDRGVVARHRPDPRRAVGQGAVTQVEHDGPLAADRDLGADGRTDAEAERAAAAARPPHRVVAERQQGRA